MHLFYDFETPEEKKAQHGAEAASAAACAISAFIGLPIGSITQFKKLGFCLGSD
jgi:hypothetical protein